MATSRKHEHVVLPFESRHMNGVRWIEEEHAKLFGMERAFKEYAANPAYSGFCDGEFVGAAGIIVPWRGFGEAWAIAGPLVASHKVFFHRTIKNHLLPLAKQLGLRRLQAMVRSEYVASRRWVQELGFTWECVLHSYGIKGEDMVVYVMFPEGRK